MSWNLAIFTLRSAPARRPFKFTRVICAACFLCLLRSNALATSITGDIVFDGKAKFNTRSLAQATEVSKWKSVGVERDTGSFADLGSSEIPVTMVTPWVFASSTPFSGLWSVGGFTFDLSSCSIVSRSGHSLDLEGTGRVSGNGFDLTSGDWAVTFRKHRRKCFFWFSFEADPITDKPRGTPVPDSGSTGVLLALGLTGLLFIVRFLGLTSKGFRV